MRIVRSGARSFELLAAAARNVVVAATLCVELYDRYPETGDRVARIGDAETEGDHITHELHDMLNGTFVTPIDREDMLALASALDTICDEIDESATVLELVGPVSVPERARAQARLVQLASERLSDATERLARMPDLAPELQDVYALEDEGDRIRRDAIARLFASGGAPLDVVRLKTIHEQLERAVDATKAAARALETIAVKNR